MRKSLSTGTPVTVHPEGHRPEDTWDGVIVKVRCWDDGTPQGLVDVECTETGGFLNQCVGQVTTVEPIRLTVRTDTEAQPALFDPIP
jgi:hypothetical protein